VPQNERREFLYEVITRGGYVITRKQYDINYDVIMAAIDAISNYRALKLSHKIDVTLFRGVGGFKGKPVDYGWNQLLLNPIRIYDIKANHYSMVDKEPIQEVAKGIKLLAKKFNF
jgi:hypothetical protein